MDIIQVIKKNTPFYKNKLGGKILKLTISDTEAIEEIIKSYERNFKKYIMENIRSTFLKSVGKLSDWN